MMAVTHPGYFDTNVLANFAAINRLDILEDRWGYRAAWTEAVNDEVRMGVNFTTYMSRVLDCSWLGTPIAFRSNELAKIQNIRSRISSVKDPPDKNLGEAESIYVIMRDGGGTFITDDVPAADYAKRNGIFVLDTCDLLVDSFAMGTTGCPESYDLLKEMDKAGRQGVRIPQSHDKVC
jgi:predicted nucleic acid-binding protein